MFSMVSTPSNLAEAAKLAQAAHYEANNNFPLAERSITPNFESRIDPRRVACYARSAAIAADRPRVVGRRSQARVFAEVYRVKGPRLAWPKKGKRGA